MNNKLFSGGLRKRGILNSPKDEFECRMELVSTEMHVSSYTDKKCISSL